MSDRIIKQKLFFNFLLTNNTLKQKKCVLYSASKSQITALSEIAVNLLRNNIPLTTAQREKLAPYKRTYRILGSKTASLARKRSVLRVKPVIHLLQVAQDLLEL